MDPWSRGRLRARSAGRRGMSRRKGTASTAPVLMLAHCSLWRRPLRRDPNPTRLASTPSRAGRRLRPPSPPMRRSRHRPSQASRHRRSGRRVVGWIAMLVLVFAVGNFLDQHWMFGRAGRVREHLRRTRGPRHDHVCHGYRITVRPTSGDGARGMVEGQGPGPGLARPGCPCPALPSSGARGQRDDAAYPVD